MKKRPSITIEESQAKSATARNIELNGEEVDINSNPPKTGNYREGKKHLHITEKKGDAFGDCASASEEYVCCNVTVLASVSACPYDCSYCFLQSYLNDAAMREVGDIDALVTEVRIKTAKEPWRFFRIGTWELGDSLALEPITGGAGQLIDKLRDLPNVLLELKTKSDNVDQLLNLDHGGRVVVSWSLNPQKVIEADELKTATLSQRLTAMAKVSEAGYLVAAHFDPMIIYDDCTEEYEELAEKLFVAVPPERVAWISMGSLRFNPEMKGQIEKNFPKSKITKAEMVRGPDGKVRYVKPIRVALYKRMYKALRDAGGKEPFIYLCMERADVWEKVTGASPRSAGDLDFLMTDSLYRRYPGLVHAEPDIRLYDNGGKTINES